MPVYIWGKVMVSDGSPLPHGVTIKRVCLNTQRTVANADTKGYISFQWGHETSVVPDASDRSLGPNATAATAVVADDVIAAHHQMFDRAHSRGIKVIGATLAPFEGAAYNHEKGEAVRTALNQWIRTGGFYDGFVDFDAGTRQPGEPTKLRSEFDSGDHLHPNDAGYKAMADSIDLSLFTPALFNKRQAGQNLPVRACDVRDNGECHDAQRERHPDPLAGSALAHLFEADVDNGGPLRG